MRVYPQLVDQSEGLAYDAFRFAGLYITRARFAPGMWQTLRYAADVRFCDLASKHFQPEGTFVNTDGVLPPRGPGWMSAADTLLVPAGIYRREAQTPTEVWCITDQGRTAGTAHVGVHRLAAGQSLPVAPGHHLLLACGTCGALGRTLEPGRLYQVESPQLTLEAATECYVIVWPR